MRLFITDPDFVRYVAALDPVQEALDNLAEDLSAAVASELSNIRSEDRWLLPLFAGWDVAGEIDRQVYVEAVTRGRASGAERSAWAEYGYQPANQRYRPGVGALGRVLNR